MNREEAKTTMSKLIDVFRKEYPNGGAFAAIHATGGYSLINKIYDAHEAELKAKDEAYAKLQQAYDNLTAQYQKDVNELKAKLEPKTCDGCEYEGDKVGGFCYAFHTTCSREPTFDHFTPYKLFRKGE